MEETKPVKAGEALSEGQVGTVAGGADSTASVGTCGVNVTDRAPDPGTALIDIYEGFVDVTSHVIERLANAAK